MFLNDIEVFISCLEQYFSKKSDDKIIVETPFLTETINHILLDFTGLISISGAYSGYIYFTAPHVFLEKLILAHGQQDFNDRLKQDVVGEITNTLSGNSRKNLGSDFVISVPKFMANNIQDTSLSHGAHSYVVPLIWMDQKAAMIVSVEKT